MFRNSRIAKFFVFTFVVYYLPVLLIRLNIIPFEFRFQTLIGTTTAMIVYSISAKYSWKSLGFRLDNLKSSLLWNGVLSALLVAITYGLYLAKMIREPSIPAWTWFYVFYIFVSSPAQEFLYRSVMFAELERANINSSFARIVISAVTFVSCTSFTGIGSRSLRPCSSALFGESYITNIQTSGA